MRMRAWADAPVFAAADECTNSDHANTQYQIIKTHKSETTQINRSGFIKQNRNILRTHRRPFASNFLYTMLYSLSNSLCIWFVIELRTRWVSILILQKMPRTDQQSESDLFRRLARIIASVPYSDSQYCNELRAHFPSSQRCETAKVKEMKVTITSRNSKYLIKTNYLFLRRGQLEMIRFYV